MKVVIVRWVVIDVISRGVSVLVDSDCSMILVMKRVLVMGVL